MQTRTQQTRRRPLARLLLCAALVLGALVTTLGCEERDAYQNADPSEDVARTEERAVERRGETLRREARSAVEDLHEAAGDVEREAARVAEDLDPQQEP